MDLPIRLRTEEERHDLYETGDADAPDAIKDRNGEVALGMCRRCGRGEIQLEEPCVGRSGDWIVNKGSQPVPNYMLVDLVLCGNFDDPVTAARADTWAWRAGLTKITHWRLHEDF